MDDILPMDAVAEHSRSPEEAEFENAVHCVNQGRLKEGYQRLGAMAKTTRDARLRSRCVLALGDVLAKMGDLHEAVRAWSMLADKPRERRNDIDRHARARIMRAFDQHALLLPVPDFPPRIQLEITNRCNLRCIMCTRNQMTRPTGDMSFETFRRVADEACLEPGVVLCLYYLGEPLLNPALERMVAHLSEVRRRSGVATVFGIQTNGMLLSRDRARSLLKAGLRGFGFSVDGLEGDLERIRPGSSYPVVERNILGLLDLAGEMGIADLEVCITKLCDDPGAPEVARFVERWRPHVANINLIHIAKVEGNAYMAADGTIRQVVPQDQARPRRYCGQGGRLLVHWNGDYAFCCPDVNGELRLGNVAGRGIREVWNSPEINDIRRRIRAADYAGLVPCRRCPHG